jgi:putative lipoic acid-binding regulatory protein
MLARTPAARRLAGGTTTSSRATAAAPLRGVVARLAPARRRAAPARATADDDNASPSPSPSSSSSTSSSTGRAKDSGEAEWRKIDKKVNKYPGPREFKAIGVDELADDGSTFAASMARCVTSVVGPVHVECVQSVPSRNGTYVAVRIGPVFVHSPEQVIEIFSNFKRDKRVKFCM